MSWNERRDFVEIAIYAIPFIFIRIINKIKKKVKLILLGPVINK
tara:strand:- start:1691 stop:1822 length:132 start_codon:yes stop_codon:yes gene_type:complete